MMSATRKGPRVNEIAAALLTIPRRTVGVISPMYAKEIVMNAPVANPLV